MRKEIPRKFIINDSLFSLEIYFAKFKYADINFIRTNCENPTSSSKMEKVLVYSEENVCKGTKNHELWN